MTFKFAVGTIVCVVLTAVFAPILAADYGQRLKTYNDNVSRNEAEMQKVKVYKNITPTIYRPPAMLSVFSAGLEKQLAGQLSNVTVQWCIISESLHDSTHHKGPHGYGSLIRG